MAKGYIINKNNKWVGKVEGAVADLNYEGLNLEFWFELNMSRNENDTAPAFNIYAKARHGRTLKVGAVWEKRNKQGEVFYQLTFEDGSLPKKVYANAYANPHGEGFLFNESIQEIDVAA